MARIVRFDTSDAAETARPQDILDGDPRTTTRNFFSTSDDRFFAGIWESTPGRWRVSYTEHEFVHLLEGEVVLIDADGHAERFVSGQSFVIPAGFRGSWETVSPVRKLYAIYQP